jgi:SAM-dependent methyltransferase
MMNPEDIAASYDRIAQYWDGPEFNRNNGIAQHERALKFRAGPGIALDVGCGSSGRIIDLLRKSGLEAEGLDLSSEMLRLARRRHPDVQFYQADICTWVMPRKYDFISAWDSIWHVPLAQQRSVIQKLCAGLKPGGVFIFTTGGVESAGERTDPCLGQPMYHAAIGIPEVLQVLSEAGCACRHLEYDQHPAPHVYIIAQRV